MMKYRVVVLNSFPYSGPSEVEVVKKPYTKLLDAYGCLGVLPASSGKDGIY